MGMLLSFFNLVILLFLLASTAFFAASEFAIVKTKQPQIDQLIARGNKKARIIESITNNLDQYLSACQLGITMCALGIGWIGGPALVNLLTPYFEFLKISEQTTTLISILVAFLILTFFHVVVGELTPKFAAVQSPERISVQIAKPLMLFYRLTFPIIWTLNYGARLISKIVGIKITPSNELAHTEEELRILLSESYKSGKINRSEFKYVTNVFEFDNRLAKEIMVPRTEIISVDINLSIEQFIQNILNEKYTRYPVTEGDKDHICGLINAKEVMTDLIANPQLKKESIENYVRPIVRAIDTTPIQKLLVEMQQKQIHLAILIDEYGGTNGLVSVEDIIEQIVGEIRDEFDYDEVPPVQKISDDRYIIDSKLLITEINDLLNININVGDVDTIGGWILSQNLHVEQGDVIAFDDYYFKVIFKEDNFVKTIEVYKKTGATA